MLEQLQRNFKDHNHPFCVGFDPDTSDLHPWLRTQLKGKEKEDFLIEWYQATINPISSGKLGRSIKFQAAFFEAFGAPGHAALKAMMADAKKRGFFVILDAKRGDIASTMRAYGESAFQDLAADALTILPWMGLDVISALKPWMQQGKAVYTVWLSSNPHGRTLQESALLASLPENKVFTLAHKMFGLWESWAKNENLQDQCGYVLGATSLPPWIEEALAARPHMLLMPGLGAQGGTINIRLKQLIHHHQASLLPLSRSLLRPAQSASIQSWQDYSKNVSDSLKVFIDEWHMVRIN